MYNIFLVTEIDSFRHLIKQYFDFGWPTGGVECVYTDIFDDRTRPREDDSAAGGQRKRANVGASEVLLLLH